MSDSDVIGWILTALAFVPLYIGLLQQRRKDRLWCDVERFQEEIHQPVESLLSIRVLYPTRTLDHCSVSVGNYPIFVSEPSTVPYETKIPAGGAHNFRVPKNVNPSLAFVFIRNGKKTIRKIKWRDIPLVKR